MNDEPDPLAAKPGEVLGGDDVETGADSGRGIQILPWLSIWSKTNDYTLLPARYSSIARGAKVMRRPAAVTVFGVLRIVFAVFGVVGVLVSLFLIFATSNPALNPLNQVMQEHPGYAIWVKVSIPLGLIVKCCIVAFGNRVVAA